MQRVDAVGEIDVVAAEAALAEHGRDLGGEFGLPRRGGVHHHAREPRRQRQPPQLAAFVGDAAVAVDGAELDQQRPRLGKRRARRRIEEGERRGIGDAPGGEIEHKAGKIGGEDFRPVGGFQRSGLRLVPQPIADAGPGAPGAAAPLVGGGARDAHGFELRQAHVGLVARHPREPAIDDDADAFDGQRGFGDRRGQHDLAPAGRRRRNGAVLHLGFERAVERDDIHRRVGEALAQQRLGAADLAGARQERQHRAGFRAHGLQHGVRHLPLDRRARVAPEITRLHRESAAQAFDHRRIAEQFCDARAVDGRRHDQELEVFAQPLLHVAGERQTEIGVERALVEFVEQQRGDAVERRIVEDHAREHALGHELDAGPPRHLGAEAHAIADGVADRLAQRVRHARGGGAGGESAAAPAR